MNPEIKSSSRRRFLQSAAAMSTGMMAARPAAGAESPLPKVKWGKAEVTKLIIGSNPFYGYSHFNSVLDGFMREYYTQDRRMEVLHRCEKEGINTWQLHYNTPTIEDYKRYRSEGGKMNWFLLADFEMMTNWDLISTVAKMGPIGIAHHGNRTDERFKARQMDRVREFTKRVRDTGVMVGVSTHNPAVVDFIEGQGWDIDYYMTCMYRASRMPEDFRESYGEAPIGEAYMEKDPERMLKMVKQTKHQCLAFKLLAAGRQVRNSQNVESAFRYVLSNIKPNDACIVGMCPKFKDEPRENVQLFGKICASLA